ncbi:MAG TPA: hypothetical protein VGC41_22320, partial [Kofleriaceae bacterium]
IAPKDAEAAAIHALASFVTTATKAFEDLDLRHSWFGVDRLLDPKHRSTVVELDQKLEAIDKDLAIVADDPRFAMELCLACWTMDWNHDGKIDERDQQLLTIDHDAHGAEIPAGDPRQKPTFRFDVGDALWARAMVSFQRAVLQLVLAYNWADAADHKGGGPTVIRLQDAGRVKRAKELVLAGLEFSDASRNAYLAETDDDREWVPSPRQKNHPIPLEIDDGIYTTWKSVVGDVRDLMSGKTGIAMKEIAGATDAQLYRIAPDAYVDLGAMFDRPTDITIPDDHGVAKGPGEAKYIDELLHGVLGHGYAESMKPSPLVKRLLGYAAELERGGDTIDRKLRYLIWIN